MFTIFQKSPQKEYLVCRTCLKAGSGASYFKIHDRKCDGNDQIKISQMLDVIVPELVLSLTKFPDICLECAKCVSVSYLFRKKCLETENMIDTYMQNVKCTSSELNLLEVSRFAQSKLKRISAQNIISDWEDDSSEDVPSEIKIQPSLKKYQIPDDFKNWLYFRTVGTRLFVKDGVLPHKSLGGELTGESEPDHLEAAAKRKDIIDRLLADSESDRTPSGGTDVEVSESSIGTSRYRLRGNKKKTCSGFKSTDCKSLGPLEKDKNNGDSSKADLCSGCGNPKFINDLSNRRIKVKRKKKRHSFEIPEENLPARRRRPNILARPAAKAKPETSTGNQTSATNENGTPSRDNPEYVLVQEPTGVCRETGLFTDHRGRYYTLDGELMPPEEVEAIRKAVSTSPTGGLTVCEETGLFKNSDEEYFSPNGTLLDRQAVETEKKTAEVRGRHLFRIGEIFSVGENDASGGDTGKRHTLRIRDISSMIDKSVGSVQEKKLRIRDISTMTGEKTGELNGEGLRIVKTIAMLPNGKEEGASNLSEQLAKIRFPLKKVRFPRKRVEGKKEAGSYQPLARSLPPQVKSLPIPEKSPPLPETPVKVTLPQATKAPLEGDLRISNAEAPSQNPSEKVVEIKKEPPDVDSESGRPESDFSILPDDEDTSSASETLNQENIQALIDSLDEADNYIDVPEFVQINKFTFNDLVALKEKGLAALEPSPGGPDASLSDSLDAGVGGVEALERLIEDQTERARPPEAEVGMGEFGASPLDAGTPVGGEDVRGSPAKKRPRRPKVKMVPVAEQPAVGTRSAYVERLVCVVRTPNREPEIRYPDREVCVLFTNYNDEGLYINDHDYLVTPYKRNMILSEEDGVNYCKCFICGSKHQVVDHVPHMNSHDSYCPICAVNLGTGYMLNLHMKSHASVCRLCSQLVAYPKITEHAKQHEETGMHTFTWSYGEEPTAPLKASKTPPNKKTPSKKRASLEKSPSAKKPSPDKKMSPVETEVEPKVKVKFEKADSPVKKAVKRRKSTDEMINEEYVDKRVLRSASKKTESNEPPST